MCDFHEFFLRQRSGNPGYLMGKPVLFGNVNSTAQTVRPYQNGLSLLHPVMPEAICPSEGSKMTAVALGVKFGYDSAVTCTIRLNRYLRHVCLYIRMVA